VYPFSLKKAKYESQTLEEKFDDLPRLVTRSSYEHRHGMLHPKEVRTLIRITSEHNRQPGAFDYNVPQNFYSIFPEIDQESYVTLGSQKDRRKVHLENDV
jgi:hypothetical protein